MKEGRIEDVRPLVVAGKLRISARLKLAALGRVDVFLDERDVSTIVPRYILAGSSNSVGMELLATIDDLVRSILIGRRVRVYEPTESVRFLPWSEVVFVPNAPKTKRVTQFRRPRTR